MRPIEISMEEEEDLEEDDENWERVRMRWREERKNQEKRRKAEKREKLLRRIREKFEQIEAEKSRSEMFAFLGKQMTYYEEKLKMARKVGDKEIEGKVMKKMLRCMSNMALFCSK